MESTVNKNDRPAGGAQPLCPVFGECLGCFYQDRTYEDELRIKEAQLKELLETCVTIPDQAYAPIVPSPKPYHYRNRLDLKLKRTKENNIFIGFTPVEKKGVLPVEACFIAEENISAFIPELKKEAIEKLPAKYRIANLTVRTGDDGRVFWGGIGRRSCELLPKDYFWTEIEGRRLFYSLDTFFQANLSILPKLFEMLAAFPVWEPRPVLYDLYGGVGLFGIGLIDQARQVFLIEENPASLKLAHYNKAFNKADDLTIIDGRVEDMLPRLLGSTEGGPAVAMIDPPRAGLSEKARAFLAGQQALDHIIYLSCNPKSLVPDLKHFVEAGWAVARVIPFDFFPKTKHIETLVLLKQGEKNQ